MAEQYPGPPGQDRELRTGERSFFTLKNLLIAAGVIAIAAAFVHGYSLLLELVFAPETSPLEITPELPPQPRLQVAPQSDLSAYRATESARLGGYRYIDRNAGIVQIPIERAMGIIAERGLPVESDISAELAQSRSGPDESGFPHPTLAPPEFPLPGQSLLALTPGTPGAVRPTPTAAAATPAPGATPVEASPELVAEGQQLFQQLGCASCHMEADSAIAPSLVGLFGETVPLQDGSTVVADAAYIHESIANPQAKLVEGYQPVMPAFGDQLSDEQLNALVAYVISLGDQ